MSFRINSGGFRINSGGFRVAPVSLPIVTDGLIINLDAGNTASYPGSGTTWTDLSGNGNNGTLTNGPTFNSANGGNIVFDGTDDYVITPYTTPIGTGGFTYAAWIKYTASQASALFSKRMGAWQFRQFGLNIADNGGADTPGKKISIVDYDGGGRILATNNEFGDGNWHYVVGTRSSSNGCRVYVDGVLQGLTGDNPTGAINLFDSNILFIAVGGENNSPMNSFNFNGSLAIAQVYNKELTGIEVSQNYNALKSRFGL